MSDNSKIQWTDATWSPVTGCTKISPGCKNCYAERMARRLAGRYGYPEAPNHFDVTFHPDRLEKPHHWKKPRRVFVCSMSDLFHEDVPNQVLYDVWWTMILEEQHTFQVLTKRPERMMEYVPGFYGGGYMPPNIWLGVTAENQKCADERIPPLLQTPAAVRFVSVEPMLEPIDLTPYMPRFLDWRTNPEPDPNGLDWAIFGCESGPGRRSIPLEIMADAVFQCTSRMVPVFVKQIEINGKVSHDPAEWPAELRVREYPEGMELTP